MDTKQKLDYIKRAMQGFKSDDLERARWAFHGLSPEEMQQQHGRSGKTRQEVLENCTRERAEWEEAMAWIEQIARRNP
jgi:hypothetical protein